MNVKEVLDDARKVLTDSNIEDAPLEAEVLLRDTLKKDRVGLYLALDDELSTEQQNAFRDRLARRLDDEPTAYIIGHREFYGRDFLVDASVLVPRPETELLVEKALEIVRKRRLSVIAEVGTGCGAVAISLALELPHVRVYATDISASALEVARVNSRKHGVSDRVHLLNCDLLGALPEPVEMVVANLPYVRETDLPRSGPVSREPRLALDGGTDGLDKIRRLCSQAKAVPGSGGHLLLEVGEGQAGAVSVFLHGLFPPALVEVTPDLSGIDRVVSMMLP
ncbi:MAG TPA: peptide chain release factor N(5)-glutamine methyltransferase [Dehalococcoidales bacterium]|nr:peptide chain release factor N(5)-glutamine methyltransferase [Dehalococcoidales bacterium]